MLATTTARSELKPMGIPESLLFFGLPALLFVAGFHLLMPWLIARGVLPYYAYFAGLGLPLFVLLVLSLVWLKLEGRTLEWPTIKERFRVKRMDRRAWLWTLAALVVALVGNGLVRQATNPLISNGIMPVPAGLPAIAAPLVSGNPNPIPALSADAGGLLGNWLALVVFLVVVFINVVGEEFWWRGVVLPRQEKAFGQWVWVLHGTMWAFFHVFKWWDVLNLLPITLALSFVASRLKNTTPGLVLHGVINGSVAIPILLAVLGVM